jgi:hypothetical protein
MTDAGAGQSQVVEWWQPRIGDRVRINLSGECPGHDLCSDAYLWDRFQGLTGIVSLPPAHSRVASEDHPDHPYYVQMDWHPQAGGIFAASELEPVEPVEPMAQPPDRAVE